MSTEQKSFLEDELYIEPTQMSARDVAGVVIALIALAVIGVSGYIWLNPQLSIQSLLARKPAAATTVTASATTPAAEHIKCPYCGMFADTSRSTVAAMFAGGGSGTFDSFDCLFNYMKENHVRLQSATVKDYTDESGQQRVDVAKGFYLYDTTETVAGSMPPYVASFASKDAAQAAKGKLGGNVMDFATLEGKWK